MSGDWKGLALMLLFIWKTCVADGGNWRQFIRWHKGITDVTVYGLWRLSTDEINKGISLFFCGVNSPVVNPGDLWTCWSCDVIYAQLEDVSRKRLSATDLPETG